MKNQTPTINIFEKAVRKVSKNLVRDFGETENLQIQSKNIGDFVTKADLKAEKELLNILQYYYPNYSYITEETGTIFGKGEETIVEAQVHLVFVSNEGKPVKNPDEIYSKFKPYFCDTIKT